MKTPVAGAMNRPIESGLHGAAIHRVQFTGVACFTVWTDISSW